MRPFLKVAQTALVVGALGMAPTSAAGAGQCPPRLKPMFGETPESIAARCNVTVESLKARNPGLNQQELDIGIGINVPRPALPSPRVEIRGNPAISGTSRPALATPRL